MAKKIVIVGLGTGGFSAALAARKVDPTVEITVFEKRAFDMFSPCSLPFAIEGILDFGSLVYSLPDFGNKFLHHEVFKINPGDKKVSARDLASGRVIEVDYDSLILAPGSSPIIPQIKGLPLGGVFTLHELESAKNISSFASKVKSAMVVGAGAIGLELASALKHKGLEVSLVEMLPHVLPKALDSDMAKEVEEVLRKLGVRLYLGKTIEEVGGGENIEFAVVGGEKINTEMLVLAVGVRANLNLARSAGVEVGRWGIKTNSRMETSIKDIYAVGDCVETVSPINHRPWVMQLANAAYKQGMVAGTNAAGGYDTYIGGLGTHVSFVGGLEVAGTGFNQSMAESSGFRVIAGKAKGKTNPMPGAKDITVKILADAEDGRVLGGQALGEGAGSRINLIALAIKGCMSVFDLSDAEMAYCPRVSEAYDVVTKAADYAIRRLEKR